jgi:hypothetical protein
MAVYFGGAEGVGSTAVGGGSGSRHVDQGVHAVMEREKYPTNKKRKVPTRGPNNKGPVVLGSCDRICR